MKKLFFLLNSTTEYNFSDLQKKYLKDVSVHIGDTLPSHPADYDLVILWNYRKIIPGVAKHNNLILFHSSFLPEGKGWAPIYNTIAHGLQYYVITCLFCHENVDAGDIILRCRFALKDCYTAELVRRWDSEISMRLIPELLMRMDSGNFTGIQQEGHGTFYPRRKPSDNEISPESKIFEVVNHLRACESGHPAFFFFNGVKYNINIYPDREPSFPEDLEITGVNDINTFHRWNHANPS